MAQAADRVQVLPSATSHAPPALDPVLAALQKQHPGADTTYVVKAYRLAVRLHQGQFRKSGEPFVSHPLGVAQILAELGMDPVTVTAGLLHDAVEDTHISLEEIRRLFDDEIAEIIDGLTKIAKIGFRTAEQAQAENYRKMIVAMARDVRVIIVKLADRLHNMRTLSWLAPDRQELKARETQQIYVPLANRLGMSQLKTELEDLSFRYLYPKRFNELVELTDRRQRDREGFVHEVIDTLKTHLEQAKITAEVYGRAKNYFSIYQKMVERGVEFDDIFDLVGVRVIVGNQTDCYTALGVVHALWKPLPGRFKDYIAMPKFNLYQSIHTTVMGPEGKSLEIQIRTHAMHRMAEFGVAAHWRYKELGGRKSAESRTPWLDEMVELQGDARDPREFLESLRLDLFHDEVFVFTPKGDVKCLPRGAGPLDFAYAVHTEVGHRTVGARVNGKLVPLNTRLESGDVIEVMTTRAAEAGPKQDWLSFAKTARARSKIRAWFAAHRREEAREQGKDIFVRALRREGVSPAAMGDDQWRMLLSVTKQSGPTTFYESLGEGKITQQGVIMQLHRIFHPDDPAAEPEPEPRPPIRKPRKAEATSAIVPGASDVLVKLARCCTPVPGDGILGFITRGKGVSVHRVDCPNARSLADQQERIIDVEWDMSQGGRFIVVLQMDALDRVGLLRDASNSLTDAGVMILSSSSRAKKDGTATLQFRFELGDVSHLDDIIRAARSIEGVFDVYRVTPLKRATDDE